LKKNVICSCLLESVPQITRNYHVDNVNLLEIDTIFVEADVKVSLKCGGQLTLDISDFADLYLSDVVSNCFLALLGQQFLQFVCTQLVQEQLAVSLSSLIVANAECDTDVDRNLHVVLGRTSFDLQLLIIDIKLQGY
jgi:hypothetical protein